MPKISILFPALPMCGGAPPQEHNPDELRAIKTVQWRELTDNLRFPLTLLIIDIAGASFPKRCKDIA